MEYHMKHTLRNSIIFCLDILGISALYRASKKSQGPLVRVIAFHDVTDAKWFEEVVSMLVSDFHVITPRQFYAREFNSRRINVLLTFDDGYQSWVDTCLPVLKKFNVKALFFINSGLLDIASDSQKVAQYMTQRLLITPKLPLTWQGAEMLVAEGHSIGGHTVTHLNVALLQATELSKEVVEDKKRIETMLGVSLVDFAYPFGTRKYFNPTTVNAVANARYTMQYSALTGFFDSAKEGLIARTLVEKNQKVARIRKWVKGGYDIFSSIKQYI